MDALLLLLAGLFLVLAINAAFPRQQPPTVVYFVQPEAPRDSGLGCMPILLLGILFIILLQSI